MLIVGTIPITEVSMTVDTTDPVEGVRQFKAAYPKARIESIDDRVVRGMCCSCKRPVMLNETGYKYDAESAAYLCPSCVEGKVQ